MSASANRRVVVGTDEGGRSSVVADAYDLAQTEPLSGFLVQEIWSQTSVPGRVGDDGTRSGDIGIEPPGAGALVRILTVAPLESADDWIPNPHGDNNRHVLTLVSGDIDLVLENDVVTLHPGDSVAMSGHVHDWRNTYGAPAILVYTSFTLHGD